MLIAYGRLAQSTAWGLQATLETSSQEVGAAYTVTTHVHCLLCNRYMWTQGLAKSLGGREAGVADTSVLG